ncbi:DUF4149 domain-containing protein [Acidovorax sp. NCPPB 3576]|uniref:DUF4149 domain-containing protein n=1 Tax=Acidovorax sp. NCPPB 3576 TaxID=2940488 RepID=UPI00234971C8|nr:DUF4149 domain-containing protein [Acidovorax sp. NCPPB 3576]WCM86342.1 DUF4149 domain-containing protein [Acidovorax sp. NCPPB 3576]
MYDRLPILAAALWWGSLSAIGFLAVPLLFIHLPAPAQAGNMAARLFEAQTFVSIACGVCLLLLSKRRHAETQEAWAQAALVFVIGGLLLALLVQYGVSPRIVARQNLRLWHSVGSVMYALQWGCALAVLWRTSSRR